MSRLLLFLAMAVLEFAQSHECDVDGNDACAVKGSAMLQMEIHQKQRQLQEPSNASEEPSNASEEPSNASEEPSNASDAKAEVDDEGGETSDKAENSTAADNDETNATTADDDDEEDDEDEDDDEDEEDGEEDGAEAPTEPPLPKCTVEQVCGPDKLLNANFELWERRSCQSVLDKEGGWVCDPDKRHTGGVRFYKKRCCRKPGEPEPVTCNIQTMCGAGKRIKDPCIRVPFKRRQPTCVRIATREGGWVCNQKKRGGPRFARKHCCEDIPDGESHLPESEFEKKCEPPKGDEHEERARKRQEKAARERANTTKDRQKDE